MLRLLVIATALVCCLEAAPRTMRPRLNGRIVGGSDADIANFPYQLSFEYYGYHRCGAAIISSNFAITAAHCADGVSASNVAFRAGSSLLESGGSLYQASKVIVHEDYDYYTTDNDISVIQVSTNFALGGSVQIIALTSTSPAAGVEATITGWGATREGGSLPNQLQVVKVPVVDHAACDQAYSSYGGVTEHMLCAGVQEGGKDACQGDSGGPMVANGQLVGLVSWGLGCARPNYPGVYADVASLRSWVTQNSGV